MCSCVVHCKAQSKTRIFAPTRCLFMDSEGRDGSLIGAPKKLTKQVVSTSPNMPRQAPLWFNMTQHDDLGKSDWMYYSWESKVHKNHDNPQQKKRFYIWIHFQIEFIPVMVKLNFQHHYSSLQCHMIRNHSYMLICCSIIIININYQYWKQMCCLIFLWKLLFRDFFDG